MDIQDIAKLLKKVSDTPLLDAKILSENCADIQTAINRRLAHEPVSKIIGQKGFWKSDFHVSKDVLDPRPDSEMIIESVLACFSDRKKTYRILDIGTGSGCLLASLLMEYPQASGVGIDKSKKAMQIAKKNLINLKAEIKERDFMIDDWMKDLGKFDIIVSNPPYIPTQDIQKLSPDVKNYDPLLALDGGEDGLDAYRQIIPRLFELLSPNGHAFFEIGINQAESVCQILKQSGFTLYQVKKDYAGIDRVVMI